MCLIVKEPQPAYDKVVYKFMLQDPEGNLWSPKFGGKMELDSERFFHSDARAERKYKLNDKVEHGLHVLEDLDSVTKVKTWFDKTDLATTFAKRFNRPEHSKLVWVKFSAYKEDLIATGENAAIRDFIGEGITCGAYLKLRFIGLLH